MKYLFNTQIERIEKCRNGRFFVRVFDAEKTEAYLATNPWNKDHKKYSYYMMDRLGRIYGEKIDEIDAHSYLPRTDKYFEVKVQGVKLLIDADQNIIAEGYEDIDSFGEDGIALIEKPKGRRYLIREDGSVFSDKFKSYGSFSYGFAPAQLENGNWVYIDQTGEIASPEFPAAYPFLNKDYAVVQSDEGQFVIDKNFNVVSGALQGVFNIDENNILWIRKENVNGKGVYVYSTIDGKQIGPEAKLIHGFNDGIARILTEEGYMFIDLQGNDLFGRKFMGAENFMGDMSVVHEGFDERDEHIFRFVKRDGTMSETFTSASMVGKNLGIAFVEGKTGKGGKFHYIDENFNLTKKGFARASSFAGGCAHFECKAGRYTYLHEDFERFKMDFPSVGYFSEGFGVIQDDAGNFDAVNSHEIMLSEISKWAYKIYINPLSFTNLPEEFFEDTELVENLSNLALEQIALKEIYHDGEKQEYSRRVIAAKNRMFDVASTKAKKQKS